MKCITIYIVGLLMISLSCLGQDTTNVANRDVISEMAPLVVNTSDSYSVQAAIVAYNEGDFRQAIALMEAQIKENKTNGLESASLYYNLGNAYYRANELGKSRLNYERAALLDPTDRDIQHNIEYLTTRIEDKILERDTLFLNNWFYAAQNLFGANAWAIIGVILFLVFIACLFAFFFTQQVLIKKTSFYIGLVVVFFVIFANIFSYKQRLKLEKRDTAVIISASVSIVTSPDINSKELFRLHSGTKVSITKNDRNWLEIEIDNGSVGWIQSDKIEII